MSQSPSAAAMGIGNVLNNKIGTSIAQTIPGIKPEQQTLQQHQILTMERAGSPHGSEHSRYSGPMNTSYPSPTAMSGPPPLPQMTTSNLAAASMGLALPPPNMVPGMAHQVSYNPPKAPHQPPKAYPCSTCGKGFARRSDLARHERIHSGVRPHVCDYPNCGKQFIQRSALTVHTRVHTGEKPHLCERCGKPFSDSSSLARHRRIHLGKRPYKCPYADCQKTFTRRTTLTRHQNHHTGTIEDAARATAEALARGASAAAAARVKTRSEGDQTSNHGSPLSTPSPAQRNLSMSPSVELSNINNMQYINNSSLPVHLRDVHVASPASTTSSGFNGVRPTSHPTGYGPPQTLEPSIEHQGPGSAIGSPHMGSTGWPSPSQAVASPTHSANGSAYNYPDPAEYSAAVGQMGQLFSSYGGNPQMRRPGSAEPGASSYEKTRPGELWAGAQ